MKVHFIVHESFEAPAAIEIWARNKGCEISYTRIYVGDSFPGSCDFDFLVVMGGPQSPATTTLECRHFDAQKEIAFIKKAIDQKKILLGVCLGAQLVGEALGARFDHSPNREIGVFPLVLTEDGKRDPLFGTFAETFKVGHWHGDMPGLTPESKVLAISEGCPRQIVRYAPTIYGFQCHFEFTREAVDGMIQNSADELKEHKDLPYVQTAEQMRAYDYSKMNSMLFQFLDHVSPPSDTARNESLKETYK
jgi:GMP synthase (glutamine-hydrolysing)